MIKSIDVGQESLLMPLSRHLIPAKQGSHNAHDYIHWTNWFGPHVLSFTQLNSKNVNWNNNI
jgi:hypothetical protein